MATPQLNWQKWFEEIWEHREERIYREFFGDLGRGIYTIPRGTFDGLGCKQPDPRWMSHGVFESPPNQRRPSWLYVTSALSNPWGEDPSKVDTSAYSGLGMELVLETPAQSRWAMGVLHWLMAVQILVGAGQLEGGLVEYYDRIPVRSPIDGGSSALRNLLIAEPEGFPGRFQLKSGKVDLMLVVGTTDAEHEFAGSQSAPELVTRLKHRGFFPVTDPARPSVV